MSLLWGVLLRKTRGVTRADGTPAETLIAGFPDGRPARQTLLHKPDISGRHPGTERHPGALAGRAVEPFGELPGHADAGSRPVLREEGAGDLFCEFAGQFGTIRRDGGSGPGG